MLNRFFQRLSTPNSPPRPKRINLVNNTRTATPHNLSIDNTRNNSSYCHVKKNSICGGSLSPNHKRKKTH